MNSTIESDGGPKKTVLLVDDESAITLLYEVDLTRRGYTVMTAHSGTEASRISAEFPNPIDVLVTDWRMPDMSGDDLACDLLDQRPNLKVVLMSGFPSAEAIAQAFPENQLVFLGKPFSPGKLDNTIRQLLGLLRPGERRVA
jgi:DNA-binding NtrC family response regulator